MSQTVNTNQTNIKGKPLINIVHDLKTPLATIMGFSEMLLRRYNQKQDLKKEWIESILSEAKRLQNLIDSELQED